jgi:hypothetical protein
VISSLHSDKTFNHELGSAEKIFGNSESVELISEYEGKEKKLMLELRYGGWRMIQELRGDENAVA